MRTLFVAVMAIGCGGGSRPGITNDPVPALEIPKLPPTKEAPTCRDRDPTSDAVPPSEPPAAYVRIDAAIRKRQASPYAYSGSVADVVGDGKDQKGQFQADVEEAESLAQRLETEVVAKGESPDWAVVALVREAEVFEDLRDAFAVVAVHTGQPPDPPGTISLFTPAQAAMFAQIQDAGATVPATQIREFMIDFWGAKKQEELDKLDGRIVKLYARAASSGPMANPAAKRALRRLGHYTTVLGNPKMAKYVPAYRDDMFLRACAELGAL